MYFNIHNKWNKLKTAMVGSIYDESFFYPIKNDKIRSSLIRIVNETQKELEHFYEILKSHNIQVIRPFIDKNLTIEYYADLNEGEINGLIPRPPLQPRDSQLVIGNTLYFTNYDHPGIKKSLVEYGNNYKHLYDTSIISENNFKKVTWAPNITVVGKDIYYDSYIDSKTKNYAEYVDLNFDSLSKELHNYKWHKLSIGGHNDAVFHTIGERKIISLKHAQNYMITFPNWDICYLENQGWNKLVDFSKEKKYIRNTWWLPFEQDNQDLEFFIDKWLNTWTGYVAETVFDVNVLMLDEHTICVSQYNKQAFNFFKKHNIEPIIIPWTHRYFWDGGLHCITLDLYREGELKDYFPSRNYMLNDMTNEKIPLIRGYE